MFKMLLYAINGRTAVQIYGCRPLASLYGDGYISVVTRFGDVVGERPWERLELAGCCTFPNDNVPSTTFHERLPGSDLALQTTN